MTIEPYFPIAPHEKGLWIGPFTKAFFLDHVWVFNEIARLRLTGTIEFYQTPDNETGVDHKLALGFSQSHKNTDFFLMRTPFTTGPKWETATVETFRREYDCLGAVEFKDGKPSAILDHRPGSPFMEQLPNCFENMVDYWKQFDPICVCPVTEKLFMELPTNTWLVRKQNPDGIKVAEDNKRLEQWQENKSHIKIGSWYVFRNKAHCHARLELNKKPYAKEKYESLEMIPYDPFRL